LGWEREEETGEKRRKWRGEGEVPDK